MNSDYSKRGPEVNNNAYIYIYIYTASVVWWSEFLATDTEVSGSIPGATRFF